MAWYDFSDWGSASWQEDSDAAREQAIEWVDTTATARGWSSSYVALAYGIIDNAYQGAESVEDFWDRLAATWGTPTGAPDGWSKLGDTWTSATGAAVSVSGAREAGSVSSVLGGTWDGTVATIEEHTDPTRSPVPWLVGGALVLGIYLWAKR